MRLLFLSNYFPPASNGGYEQLCEEAAQEFVRRRHAVTVLTSRGPNGPATAPHHGGRVLRCLNLEVQAGLLETTKRLVLDRRRLEQENSDSLTDTVADFRPDAALVWGMWNVPRGVPARLEQLMPGRVLYYLCDYWPSLPSAYLQQWQEPAKGVLGRWPKRLLSPVFGALLASEPPVPLRLERAACVSSSLRDSLVESGVLPENAWVVHNGIKAENYPFRPERRESRPGAGLRLLYAGRISREKGVHTAIDAMEILDRAGRREVTLDIVGSGNLAYLGELAAAATSNGLDGSVTFRHGVPRSEMPRVLSEYDALVFPSEWEEPLARIVMEAMAQGLVVLGTTTGGTRELLEDDVTGLTFTPRDAAGLASQIGRLIDAPDLSQRLKVTARRRVERDFTFDRMADQLEAAIRDAVEDDPQPRSYLPTTA